MQYLAELKESCHNVIIYAYLKSFRRRLNLHLKLPYEKKTQKA